MRRGGLLVDGRTAGIVAVGGALLLWFTITTAAAVSTGHPPLDSSSWARWDSYHYLTIAERGYEVGSCEGVPDREPGDLCGNAGWFPGYPYLVRAAGHLGVSTELAARLIPLAALAGMFTVLWTCFLARRPRAQGLAAMALAAAFPGSVYYGAVFPVSLTVLAMLGCLALIDRQRWASAGAMGALATVMYSSGVAVGAVAVLPFLDRTVVSWRERLRTSLWLGVPPALAYAAVHLEMWRTTGRWSAWFEVQGAYDFALTFPLAGLGYQVRYLIDGEPWIALQTMLVVALIWLAAHAAWDHRSELGDAELATVPLVAALWIIPLTVGAALSLWRAESLLLPVVILLARLPAKTLSILVALAVPVAVGMARLFFQTTLI